MTTVTMTAAEAEALFEAAEYARKQRWGNDPAALNRAVSKLRRASTLIIEQEE